MENFTRLSRQLIPRHFTPAPAKPPAEEGKVDDESAAVAAPSPPSAPESFCTWKCEFNARNMKTIARKDVYAAIEELIDKRHKVGSYMPQAGRQAGTWFVDASTNRSGQSDEP